MKKKIRCKFVGNLSSIKDLLAQQYELIECDSPDFAFFTCAEHNISYQYDCVRILIMGENQRPDFNLFDYAAGFDQMTFADRYLYYPLYAQMEYRNSMQAALEKHMYSDDYYLNRHKFCNMVVSNVCSASEKRIDFFHKLCNYKLVDSGGKSFNNLPGGQPVADKVDFQKSYKFSLAFENSSYPGYTTEKIIQAWEAGTIPIYWGDPTIAEQFNEKAFVNCHRYESWEQVIDEIKKIDEDQTLYMKMQREPIYKEGSRLKELLESDYLSRWLFPILNQNPKDALKRTNAHEGWGYYVEKDLKDFCQMSESTLVQAAYRIVKKVHGWK